MISEKKKIERNVMSAEEYLKRRKLCQKEKRSESETYSFELSSDSFLKSLVKIVIP